MQEIELTDTAGAEVTSVVDIVRPASEWLVWAYLVVGLSATIILIFAPPITSGVSSYLVMVALPSFAVGVIAYALSQPVDGRRRGRPDAWVIGPFLVLVAVGVVYRLATHPQHVDTVVLVLALLPLAPCLWGAFEARER